MRENSNIRLLRQVWYFIISWSWRLRRLFFSLDDCVGQIIWCQKLTLYLKQDWPNCSNMVVIWFHFYIYVYFNSSASYKMTAILQATFLKSTFLNENIWIQTKISLKFVPVGLIDVNWTLAQAMAWRQATSHYLNKWWLGLNDIYIHICELRLRSHYTFNVCGLDK